jgi:CBS domain-containing protein
MSSTHAVALPSLKGLTVEAVMHTAIVHARPHSSPAALAAEMVVHQVHGLVAGTPERYITDLDVIDAALADATEVAAGRSGHALPVVAADTPLPAALRAMSDADATHAIVRRGRPAAGIVSALDVAALVAGEDVRRSGQPRPRPARPGRSEHRLSHVSARDAMHPGVVALPPSATIVEFAAALSRHHFHAVVVAGIRTDREAERFVWGFATGRDLIHALAREAHDAVVADLAGTEVVCVEPDDPLDLVAGQLIAHGVSHAVVGSAGEMPFGIVSTMDLMEVVAAGDP